MRGIEEDILNAVSAKIVRTILDSWLKFERSTVVVVYLIPLFICLSTCRLSRHPVLQFFVAISSKPSGGARSLKVVEVLRVIYQCGRRRQRNGLQTVAKYFGGAVDRFSAKENESSSDGFCNLVAVV